MENNGNAEENFTVERVNQILLQAQGEGQEWIAIHPTQTHVPELTGSGFELVQGQVVNGEIISTTCDSIPVLRALEIGNEIRLVLLDGKEVNFHTHLQLGPMLDEAQAA